MLLLEAIERGELVAPPLEIARLQAVVESYRETIADDRSMQIVSIPASEEAVRRRRRRARAEAPAGTVVTYLRVSSSQQALSGLGLEAERATVAAYAERKGLVIVGSTATRALARSP